MQRNLQEKKNRKSAEKLRNFASEPRPGSYASFFFEEQAFISTRAYLNQDLNYMHTLFFKNEQISEPRPGSDANPIFRKHQNQVCVRKMQSFKYSCPKNVISKKCASDVPEAPFLLYFKKKRKT